MQSSKFVEIEQTAETIEYTFSNVGYNQGCSATGTRGNGVPTPFSCFTLK